MMENRSHCWFDADQAGPCRPLYKGGGGSAGEVGFADYVETVHTDWIGNATDSNAIDTTIPEVMNSLFTTAATENNPNPYFNSEAYDAETDMAAIVSAYTRLTDVDGYLHYFDHTDRPAQTNVEFEALLNNVQNKIDATNITLSAIDISAIVQTLITKNLASSLAIALQTVSDSITNTDSIVDGAIAKALEVLNSQDITDTIKVFSDRISTEVNRIKGTFSAGMVDINAVMSSAFIFGNSNIEVQRVRSIAEFTNNLTTSLYNQVILTYIQSAVGLSSQELHAFNNVFVNNLNGEITSNLQARQVRDTRLDQDTGLASNMLFGNISNELARVTLAQNTYNTKALQLYTRDQEDLRINAESQIWDMKIYTGGAGILSSLNTGGGQFIPEGSSSTAQAASGVLAGSVAGATIGAKIGAAGGPIGALGGAVIGAGIGLIAGLE